jgi:hypothetical protein
MPVPVRPSRRLRPRTDPARREGRPASHASNEPCAGSGRLGVVVKADGRSLPASDGGEAGDGLGSAVLGTDGRDGRVSRMIAVHRVGSSDDRMEGIDAVEV